MEVTEFSSLGLDTPPQGRESHDPSKQQQVCSKLKHRDAETTYIPA